MLRHLLGSRPRRLCRHEPMSASSPTCGNAENNFAPSCYLGDSRRLHLLPSSNATIGGETYAPFEFRRATRWLRRRCSRVSRRLDRAGSDVDKSATHCAYRDHFSSRSKRSRAVSYWCGGATCCTARPVSVSATGVHHGKTRCGFGPNRRLDRSYWSRSCRDLRMRRRPLRPHCVA